MQVINPDMCLAVCVWGHVMGTAADVYSRTYPPTPTPAKSYTYLWLYS